MLHDFIKKYRNKDIFDLSCSETIVMAANDAYNLNLNDDFLHAMAPFSGGMYADQTCGALTGGLAILGVLFTDKTAHNSEFLKEINQFFFKAFKEKLSCFNCENLKELHRTEESGCNSIMYATGEVLENTIETFKKYRKK